MKKVLIFFAAGLFMVGPIKAQESSMGIKGGANISTLSEDSDSDKNMKLGFHVGVFNKIAITEGFAIQPELIYSRQGLKLEYSGFADGNTNFNLNYINLPVKMVFNLTEHFELQFGPYVGYLINAKVKTNAEILDKWDFDSEDDIDRKNFNDIDYGISAGIGFDFNQFIIGANYNLGLNEVAKSNKAQTILGDAKNNVIQVYVGLKF